MHSHDQLFPSDRLEALLAEFPNRTIGLIGDLFLDRYLLIEPGVHEMSVETGLEAYQVTTVRNAPGALGTIINNLVALGVGRIVPLAVIGNDGHGDDLIRELEKLPGVDLSGIVRCPTRLTPTYTKPMRKAADGLWSELNRLDIRDRQPLAAEAEQQMLAGLEASFDQADGWIVLDQIVESNWGIVNAAVRDGLRREAQRNESSLVYVDSRQHLAEFDFGVVKCNQDELLKASGRSTFNANRDTIADAAVAFAQRTGRDALCTLGEEGMLAATPQGRVDYIPGFPVDGPTDIVGAGDAASSAVVATLLSGGTTVEACQLGCLAASVTVQKIGETGSASRDELRTRFAEVEDS